ncbi:c-type cytochrome [soil metagenome]|jgi:mono/diheme cytochrome c family protein
MKKFKKGLFYTIVAVILLIITAVSYITFALPDVGQPENLSIALTPQRIQRGKYLAIHVSACLDCHSPHDWTLFAAPIDTLRLGAGGQKFDSGVGFPGTVIVPNLTPSHLKEWTDGEVFRAITTGVKKDGSAIFPLMPWPYYSKMDREDVYAIIAYLRTLKPIDAVYPKSTLDFPLNILVHTMPQRAVLGIKPDEHDTLKYGEYLVQSAACKDCHSRDEKGKLIAGMEFAGGKEYTVSGNTLRSANITPDVNTGIGAWTRAAFIARFKAFMDAGKASHVNQQDFQTIMPWWEYSDLSDNDLKAIYAFLRTVKPVSNKVVKFQVNSAPVTSSK